MLFVVFMLHINFLLKNIFLGQEEAQFFDQAMTYNFDAATSILALQFVALCMLGFYLGYKIIYRGDNFACYNKKIYITRMTTSVTVASSILIILYVLYVGYVSDLSYGLMHQFRSKNGFIFELRVIYLVLLSFHLLNIPIRALAKEKKYKWLRITFVLYCIALISFKARSPMFEVFIVFFYSYAMWTKDKFKFKYVLIFSALLIFPNLLVMLRMEAPENWHTFIASLFYFEYEILLNNILGAVIFYQVDNEHISFISQIQLIVPSFLRDLFEFTKPNYDYIERVSSLSQVSGGGFSLIAQLYSDFKFNSFFIFLLIGMVIGWLNKKSLNVGRVSLFYAISPLIYSMFVLSLRNDFGVFFKYSIQIMILGLIMEFFRRGVKTR